MAPLLHKLFGAISKVEEQDDGTLMVFGIASSGAVDGAGEIITPAAMKAALPDYAKFPALREMHQSTAAGRVTEAEVDEDGFTRIAAHVVDPIAVKKVRAGVYPAFSIGGKVLKRDPQDRTIITGLRLVEISLVDSPCNPDAALTMWKNDMPDFSPAREDVIEKAKALAKAANTKRYRDFLFDAREDLIADHMMKAAEAQEADEAALAEVDALPADAAPAAEPLEPVAEIAVELPSDVEPAADEPAKDAAAAIDPEDTDHGGEGPDGAGDEIKAAKAEAIDPAAALADAIAKAGEVISDAAPKEPEAPISPFADLAKAAEALGAIELKSELAKGLYEVCRFADLLSAFADLQKCVEFEADAEGDGSDMPAKLAKAVADMGALLVEMTQEEIAEVIADMANDSDASMSFGDNPEIMMLAEAIVDLVKADEDRMEKAGARNSKTDAGRIQASHDHMAKLGAACDVGNCADADKAAEISADRDRLAKALEAAAPAVEEVTKRFAETVDGLKANIADLEKRFSELDQTVIPAKTAGGPSASRVVTKGADSTGAADGPTSATVDPETFEKAMAGMSEEERHRVLIKIALQQPQPVLRR